MHQEPASEVVSTLTKIPQFFLDPKFVSAVLQRNNAGAFWHMASSERSGTTHAGTCLVNNINQMSTKWWVWISIIVYMTCVHVCMRLSLCVRGLHSIDYPSLMVRLAQKVTNFILLNDWISSDSVQKNALWGKVRGTGLKQYIYHYWMSNEATHPIKGSNNNNNNHNHNHNHNQIHNFIGWYRMGIHPNALTCQWKIIHFLYMTTKDFPGFPQSWDFYGLFDLPLFISCSHRPSHLSPPVLVWRATETFLWCLDPISASAGSSVRAPLHRPPLKHPWRFLHPPPKTGNTSWHTKRLESSAWGQNWNMRGESFSVVFSCVFVIVLNIKLNQSTAIWVWSNLYRSSAVNIFFMSILAQSWIFVPLP